MAQRFWWRDRKGGIQNIGSLDNDVLTGVSRVSDRWLLKEYTPACSNISWAVRTCRLHQFPGFDSAKAAATNMRVQCSQQLLLKSPMPVHRTSVWQFCPQQGDRVRRAMGRGNPELLCPFQKCHSVIQWSKKGRKRLEKTWQLLYYIKSARVLRLACVNALPRDSTPDL